MKQRLGIAAAIMENPDIIILDEPTNALDDDGIEVVKKIVYEEKQRGALIIISCHDAAVLNELSDEVFCINNGKIVADEKVSALQAFMGKAVNIKIKVAGPSKEVYNLLKSIPGVTRVDESGFKEGDTYTFIVESSSGVDVRKPIFNALSKKGWPIMGLENTEGELEDVFVKLIERK